MRQAGAAGTAVHHSPPPAREARYGERGDQQHRQTTMAIGTAMALWTAARTCEPGSAPAMGESRDAKLGHGLLHHLSDLLGYCQRQPQRLTDDLIDRFPGCTIDHQVSFLARREESRIIEHGLKRAAQRREPLWRHARRGENGAADFAGAGGRVQDLTAFVRLRELREGWHVWEQAMPLDRGLVEDGRFTPVHPAG